LPSARRIPLPHPFLLTITTDLGRSYLNVRKFILRETALLALGELVCSAAIVGVFAMLGHFSYKVILGVAIGCILAVGNFFFMAISSNAVADRAIADGEGEDTVKRGKSAMKLSYTTRLLIIGVLLFAFAGFRRSVSARLTGRLGSAILCGASVPVRLRRGRLSAMAVASGAVSVLPVSLPLSRRLFLRLCCGRLSGRNGLCTALAGRSLPLAVSAAAAPAGLLRSVLIGILIRLCL
jgi:hypothetical protein